MTDEKYVFVSDMKDKKRTARGAFNRRTHAGKGGAVKLPCDFMTKKERDAMNGEVKSYKLNSPMKWAEFKSMPDDLQCTYIKALQSKYNASAKTIAAMFGVAQQTLSARMIELKIATGKGGKRPKLDADGWAKFIHGIKDGADATAAATLAENATVQAETAAVVEEPAKPDLGGVNISSKEEETPENIKLINPGVPVSGTLAFEGGADDALQTMKDILKNSHVRLVVTWEPMT